MRNVLSPPDGADGGGTIEPLRTHTAFTMEHFASRGKACPVGFRHYQSRDEWVMQLRGEAEPRFDNDESATLRTGEALTIPAHHRPRVERTSVDAFFLELHFDADAPR